MAGSTGTGGRPWTMRVAAAITMAVGAVNVVVALVSTSVSGLSIEPVIAAALGAAGLATVWLGWRMWAGATWALHLGAVVFSLLLIAQLAFADPETPETGTSRVVLVGLVVALLVAAVHVRRRSDGVSTTV